MKKSLKVITVLTAAVFLGITGAYGYFSDTVKVDNNVAVGDINIKLTEHQKKGSTETNYEDPPYILPGAEISKIPRITNQARPCWIRTRIVFENDRKEVEGLSEKNISGISKNWVKRGEYYYFTKILKRKESVELFNKVTVPVSWTEEHTGQKLGITVEAEAVQAENFTPDFEGMSPWGNQEIQVCVHEAEGAPLCPPPETKLSVEFNGKAHKLLAVPGDFFQNFGTLMPGDQAEDEITLSNTTDQEAEIFFQTEAISEEMDKLELLRGISLQITMDGKKLYRGTLDSPSLEKAHSLGSFSPGEKGKLKFLLSVPVEWDNSYALRKAQVQWRFTVKEDGENNEKLPDGEQDPGSAAHGNPERTAPKTGDISRVETFIWLLTGAVGMAVLLLTAFMIRKRG